MNEEILKEFEVLKKIIRLAIDSNNGQPVMEYLHEILKCDFIFYNYVQNNRIVIGTEENVLDSDCFEYEIGFKNELLGKILINIAKENITDFMKKVLSYVADAFVLINKEKFSVERVEKDLKQELVLDICTGNIKSREELSIRSKLNGWEIKDNLVVVIFDVDEYKKKTVDLKESSREIEVVKEKMFRDLKNNFLDAGMTFYNYQNSDSIIFLFEFDNNYLQSKDKLFKKMMKESIEEYGFTYTVGIGRIVNNIFDAPISYTEAREAVKIGRSMLGLGMIHEYKDLELFSLLNNAVNKDILAGELMRPIRKLIEYDKENETEYYIFLKELINANWSLTRASENNYIHYNTAKYRLKKTEEIMDLQVDTANSRFKLELALRLYELKNMV
ncbi:MAG: PucR family transcriptional regulator [Catonella sp.]